MKVYRVPSHHTRDKYYACSRIWQPVKSEKLHSRGIISKIDFNSKQSVSLHATPKILVIPKKKKTQQDEKIGIFESEQNFFVQILWNYEDTTGNFLCPF